MALALYRRYRPDTFAGVIGQDQVTQPLMRALDEHRLTHAYLFSGPRGCGKTSSARILARCVNCAEGPTSQPCGVCPSCKDLAAGGPGSIDVVEIDAASHNGVDDARELRERAGFAPARDRYKIFILDEAHMVTQQGFNALLKIVEEPPEHVMFIFATTEPDKVIGTIRSRTHHYPFRLVPEEIMGPYLEEICAKEGVTAQPGVLKLAMRAGGGSVRDTLSVLDQLMVGAVDGTITYDAAVALLGFTPDVLIGEAVDAVIAHDGAAFYEVVQKVIVGGFDARRFVEDLLARTRDLLVLTLGGDRVERALSEDEAQDMDHLREQAHALGLTSLSAMAQIMDDTLMTMAGAISPRMRLELMAAKLLAGRETNYAPAQAAAGPQVPAGQEGAGRQHQGGFIGSAARKTAEAGQAAPAGQGGHPAPRPTAQPDAAAWPSAGVSPAPESAEAASPRPAAVPAQPASPASAGVAAPGAPGQQDGGTAWPATPSSATAIPAAPDEQWDGLVASLPVDVAQYVDRTKVPRVHFTRDARSGRGRLWIKFDTPMSKYAFALAHAKEEVQGKSDVVDIVRAAVHRVFGADVALAPTEQMADGQSAPPFGKLPEDQQQRIKTQLTRESLQAAMGIHQTPREASTQPSPSSSSETATAQDGPADHRAVPKVDPWALPDSAPVHIDFDKVASIEQEAASHQAQMRVQVDPWSHSEPAPSPDAQGEAPAVPTPASGPAAPQVDPDEDEYSMSDESLGSSGAMSVDEVKELFEVKRVEDFAADDPHNPRNNRRKTRDEH
ncbi:DNA polymerase III subunit gamma and tau [Bifidobacterium cuniculi]|uniref:DNA polymerase III subunit gamma/tau n=1 Tax=Bifidobacterium cuniculi TaxID=1688 RepID=A0A087B2R7_9BIFI|nr:DNA polymerase III subunit gamma and tau [Bifidobacterium cuniculi]KFI65317.1 DNA polymerase III, subunits gamma and tau [Bifidobacterium cuniculi]